MQSACGDADISDKEMQIIHKEFINERESRNNHQDSHSRLQNIDDLTDMGFNLTRFSPILTIGDTAPKTPVGSGTTTPVLTSPPRPSGGSRLHSSDPTSNKRYTHEGNLHNSFTGVVGQVEQQNLMGAESGPKTSGTGDSAPTFDTTKFYPGEVPFRNQGTSTSPVVMETTRNLPPQQNTGKGGKKKSSHRDQPETQPQPSTSNGGTNTTSVFPPRNAGTGRPHIQCSACGGNDHFRKDCQQDNFCTRCRSRSHATHHVQSTSK